MRLASCAATDGCVHGTVPFLLSAGVVQAVERMLAVAFKNTVELGSMMGVLGTKGGFVFALFQGWDGVVKYSSKMCSSNFSFRNKFVIFL